MTHGACFPPRWRRLQAILLISSALLATGGARLAAEGRAEAPAERSLQIFGLKGPTSIGMLPLFGDPPDLGAGYRASVQAVSTPDLIVSRLLSGEADFAFLPVNLAANLYARGVPIQLAATTGGGVLYVVTSRSDIHSLRDLAGKTLYGSSKGSAPEFIMDYLLEKSGVDPVRGLTQVFTYAHSELALALAAGRVDLALLPEPFVSIALAKNPALKVAIDLQREWGRIEGSGSSYPLTALGVKRKLAAEDRNAVTRFLAAERSSMGWVVAHPAEAGALAQRYLDMPGEVVAAAVPRLSLRFVPAGEARTAVRRFLAVLYSYDPASIGGRMPDERFYLSY